MKSQQEDGLCSQSKKMVCEVQQEDDLFKYNKEMVC